MHNHAPPRCLPPPPPPQKGPPPPAAKWPRPRAGPRRAGGVRMVGNKGGWVVLPPRDEEREDKEKGRCEAEQKISAAQGARETKRSLTEETRRPPAPVFALRSRRQPQFLPLPRGRQNLTVPPGSAASFQRSEKRRRLPPKIRRAPLRAWHKKQDARRAAKPNIKKGEGRRRARARNPYVSSKHDPALRRRSWPSWRRRPTRRRPSWRRRGPTRRRSAWRWSSWRAWPSPSSWRARRRRP